jgi:hypothetical protein
MKGKTGNRNCFNCAYYFTAASGRPLCKKGLLGRQDNPETECVYWKGKGKEVEKI